MHRYLTFAVVIFLLFSCEKEKKETKVISPIESVQQSIAEIVKLTTPSIVTIFTHPKEKEKNPQIFKYFEDIPQYENESLGSGFVIKKDEKYIYIATNTHVIEKANNITVKFFNDVEMHAEIVGTDQKTDIAVLKVKINENTVNITPVKFGDEDDLKIGYFAIAAGSPYNLGHTFTFGIISALGRNLGISTYENFIQTDAAINPGDSGGPLLNIKGEVIGMNTAIIQTGQGLGFAIPVSTVKSITEELMKYGKVIRGWLGILVQDVSKKLKQKYKINNGVIIIKVFKNSPAYKAGLKVGDIITHVNDQSIKSSKELKNFIAILKPGEEISVSILRNGEHKTLKIKIEIVPEKNIW